MEGALQQKNTASIQEEFDLLVGDASIPHMDEPKELSGEEAFDLDAYASEGSSLSERDIEQCALMCEDDELTLDRSTVADEDGLSIHMHEESDLLLYRHKKERTPTNSHTVRFTDIMRDFFTFSGGSLYHAAKHLPQAGTQVVHTYSFTEGKRASDRVEDGNEFQLFFLGYPLVFLFNLCLLLLLGLHPM